MVTRERLKQEIDRVQENYLDILFRIIQAFEQTSPTKQRDILPHSSESPDDAAQEWHAFVESTYGSLASDPIERGDQGTYEVREPIQ
ncbi:MAG: hypothetical protein GVY30_01970 [Chloroflexi bacterium]|jgi:hypothetical protein|nr:hypothetical protein [Chloroflexota bacterium]